MECFCVASAHLEKKQPKLRRYRLHQLQQHDTAANIQRCHWFHNFESEGVHVYKAELCFQWKTLINLLASSSNT
jgi:hypothetical protein